MGAERFPVSDLPEGSTLEAWGDNTAWLVSTDGAWRMPLREWAENMPRSSECPRVEGGHLCLLPLSDGRCSVHGEPPHVARGGASDG